MNRMKRRKRGGFVLVLMAVGLTGLLTMAMVNTSQAGGQLLDQTAELRQRAIARSLAASAEAWARANTDQLAAGQHVALPADSLTDLPAQVTVGRTGPDAGQAEVGIETPAGRLNLRTSFALPPGQFED